MKLFGGKHHSHHGGSHPAPKAAKKKTDGAVQPSKDAGSAQKSSESSKKHKLTGTQRGLLMLLASVAVLALVIFGVMKAMIKPPD